MLTKRFGNWQPFTDVNSREDNRYAGLQAGLVTYHTEDGVDGETYKTSYVEVGGRSDHIADPLMDLFNVEREPQTVANASATDARRLRKLDDSSDTKTSEAAA